MTEKDLVEDYRMVLHEAKSMGCSEIKALYNIPIKNMEMLVQALEKQIPKKPDCIEDKIWCCPVCYNNLLHKWIKYPTMLMPKSEGLPHCMSCGQAIDWSDEE